MDQLTFASIVYVLNPDMGCPFLSLLQSDKTVIADVGLELLESFLLQCAGLWSSCPGSCARCLPTSSG